MNVICDILDRLEAQKDDFRLQDKSDRKFAVNFLFHLGNGNICF